jgi:hypothetical protein
MKNKLLLLLIVFISCTEKNKKEDVESLLNQYSNFIKSNKPDSISTLYASNGKLSGEGQLAIVSPDSIGNFLKGFSDFNVLEYKFTSDSIFFQKDSAFAIGSYFQKVVIPAGDTLELGGKYSVDFTRNASNQWLIGKMYTYDYRNLKTK